jgi:hypothetical protein
MNLRTTSSYARTFRRSGINNRPPVPGRRPALYLAAAAAGAVMVGALTAGEPAADAAQLESVSVAEQLGIPAEAAPVSGDELVAPLQELAASRSEREAAQAAAAQVQAAADQAEADRRAAEEAARVAAEEAARVAAEEAARVAAEEAARAEQARAAEAAAAAARPGQGTSAPSAPAGSYKEYAMGKVGSASEFGCLERLWGKESGWNPNAQNPSSTAYGIAQFLNSTWAGTGIAKTSDGYRQIDAGLIYIEKAYGSPCGAWAKSQSSGWY